MSIKDYLKIINVQDLTTGDIICSVPINHDRLLTTQLSLYELDLLTNIIDLLQNEHSVCIKTGYKSE